MASPAPLTTQPTSPSSLMKVRLASRAVTSAGSSELSSRSASTSGRRKSSLSSMLNLASMAFTSPEGVVMSGLISASEAPASTNAVYSCCRILAAARCCLGSV